jgi:hypothetical protein
MMPLKIARRLGVIARSPSRADSEDERARRDADRRAAWSEEHLDALELAAILRREIASNEYTDRRRRGLYRELDRAERRAARAWAALEREEARRR